MNTLFENRKIHNEAFYVLFSIELLFANIDPCAHRPGGTPEGLT